MSFRFVRWFLGLLAIGITVVACGGPAPSPTPSVTPAPTPLPLSTVSRQQLPGMVLAEADLDAALAGLQISVTSGYFDAQRVVTHTLDPADTIADVQRHGFVAGYEHNFSDPRLQVGPTFTSRVYLWHSPESATAFIQRFRDDLTRLTGSETGGVTLKSFQILETPNLGEEALAVEMTSAIGDLGGLQVYTTSVLWRRGPLLTSASLLVFDPSDYQATVVRLARRSDERIDGVLAGAITAKAYIPPAATGPQTGPLPQVTAPVAPSPGFDLATMLLTPGDLSNQAKVSSEGPLQTAGTLQAYHRAFLPADTAILYGSSKLAQVLNFVELYQSPITAQSNINYIRSLPPEEITKMVQPDSSKPAGASPPAVTVEVVDLPPIGDVSIGLNAKAVTPAGSLQTYAVHFTEGRVRGQVVLSGLEGDVALADVVSLAQFFASKVEAQLPE